MAENKIKKNSLENDMVEFMETIQKKINNCGYEGVILGLIKLNKKTVDKSKNCKKNLKFYIL